MTSKARNLAGLLSDGVIGTAELADGSITAAKLAASLDLSSKTLTYPDNSVQSNDIASLAASKLTGAGTIVQTQGYTSGYGVGARTITSAVAWSTVEISGTSLDGPRDIISPNANVFRFEKLRSDTQLRIRVAFPWYMLGGAAGFGLRIQYYAGTGSIASGLSYNTLEKLPQGVADGWGFGGYGGNAGVANWMVDTAHGSAPSFFLTRTGAQYFFFQVYCWSGTSLALNDYSADFPKYGSWVVEEYIA